MRYFFFGSPLLKFDAEIHTPRCGANNDKIDMCRSCGHIFYDPIRTLFERRGPARTDHMVG